MRKFEAEGQEFVDLFKKLLLLERTGKASDEHWEKTLSMLQNTNLDNYSNRMFLFLIFHIVFGREGCGAHFVGKGIF